MRIGTHHSPEVRQRVSEARRKAWANPEVRQRMSEARRKALANPEVRQRMSEARRKAWAGKTIATKGFCSECAAGNCLACDGDGCRCPCSLELDRPRIPHRRFA